MGGVLKAIFLLSFVSAIYAQGYRVSEVYNAASDTYRNKDGVYLYKNAWTGNKGFTTDALRISFPASNTCYNLEDGWNNAVNSIDTRGYCVILYDLKDCQGHRGLRMDRFGYAYNWLAYNYFGSLTSSLRLCEPDYNVDSASGSYSGPQKN